jgi:hypothetical protein
MNHCEPPQNWLRAPAAIQIAARQKPPQTAEQQELINLDKVLYRTLVQFEWNETYIATTSRGERYSGRLVGRDGDAFMMRTDDNRILVGRAADIDPVIPSGERLSFRAT